MAEASVITIILIVTMMDDDDVPRETGDDIDRPDVQGMTMLMWAAAYGQTPTAQLLINHGANVNTAGKELGRPNKKYA